MKVYYTIYVDPETDYKIIYIYTITDNEIKQIEELNILQTDNSAEAVLNYFGQFRKHVIVSEL